MKEQRWRWFGLVEKMVDERTSVKAKKCVDVDSKYGESTKRYKEVLEKGMLVRGFRSMDARTAFYGSLAAKIDSPLLVENTSQVPRR